MKETKNNQIVLKICSHVSYEIMSTSKRKGLQGECKVCDQKFSKSGMTKHVTSKCNNSVIITPNNKDSSKIFIILVEDKYGPMWWLYVGIDQNAKLSDLDDFLRYFWLECCGHLSEFEINNVCYKSDPTGDLFVSSNHSLNGDNEKNMQTTIGEVLNNGLKFDYVYDWGTSTILKLKVKSVTPGLLFEKITLLAQNEKPNIGCMYCKENRADLICTECIWNTDEGYFCNSCEKKHKCDDDYFLPFVNSPRTGQCAYEGSLN